MTAFASGASGSVPRSKPHGCVLHADAAPCRGSGVESRFDVEQVLPNAGSALENPFVYDAIAKELKTMAAKGLVEIVGEHSAPYAGELLIDPLKFKRLR